MGRQVFSMGQMLQTAPAERGFLAHNGLTNLETVFRLNSGVCLDKAGLESWRQRWRMSLPDEQGRPRTVYLKRFQHPPLRRQWERWREGHLGLSTAGVEWTNARLLAEAGVAAVEAIAFGQEMAGPWERRSFVLTREVAGESLERWVPVHLSPAARETDWPRRRRLLARLAELVGRLHAAGFVHRDLYLAHIFIEGDGLRLIDLQRVFRPRWRRRRWVIKDLAALHFSTPADRVGRLERLRFLCRYVRVCGAVGSARTLARLIDAKVRRMARRRPELAVGLSRESS
jgi:hypothetical protein